MLLRTVRQDHAHCWRPTLTEITGGSDVLRSAGICVDYREEDEIVAWGLCRACYPRDWRDKREVKPDKFSKAHDAAAVRQGRGDGELKAAPLAAFGIDVARSLVFYN